MKARQRKLRASHNLLNRKFTIRCCRWNPSFLLVRDWRGFITFLVRKSIPGDYYILCSCHRGLITSTILCSKDLSIVYLPCRVYYSILRASIFAASLGRSILFNNVISHYDKYSPTWCDVNYHWNVMIFFTVVNFFLLETTVRIDQFCMKSRSKVDWKVMNSYTWNLKMFRKRLKKLSVIFFSSFI